MLGSTGSTLGSCIDKVQTWEDPSGPSNKPHRLSERVSSEELKICMNLAT